MEPNAADFFSRPLHLAARHGLRVLDVGSQVGQLSERAFLPTLLSRRGRRHSRGNLHYGAVRQLATPGLARPLEAVSWPAGIPQCHTGQASRSERP